MKNEEHERAAELIAMLLRDPSARASFRRSPADVCRAHGLEDVASELAGREGALQTLDVRESRSSAELKGEATHHRELMQKTTSHGPTRHTPRMEGSDE